MRSAIVAGGNAMRFGGRPKGLERVGGERIIDRVAAVLEEATAVTPLLIANDPSASEWLQGIDAIPDVRERRGALVGIHTAIVATGGPVLVAAWDMPFLEPGLLRELVAGSGEYDAYLPESGGRRGVEPLCAVYTYNCIAPIEWALEAGDQRAISFHNDVRVGTLPLEEVEKHGNCDTLFFNVNTVDDLRTAEEMWARHA
ncbi:MAG: molybdenum cofactor guanylyltransferase [Gemmatimonadales bacterium]